MELAVLLWIFGKEHWSRDGRIGIGRIGGITLGPMANPPSSTALAKSATAVKKCVPMSENVIEGKAPEKTGALQKLRQLGYCIAQRRRDPGRHLFLARPRLFSFILSGFWEEDARD